MSTPFEQIMVGADVEFADDAELSLLETLDHVLNRGLVIAGEITIAVADVDLVTDLPIADLPRVSGHSPTVSSQTG